MDCKTIAITKGSERDAILDTIERECGFRPIPKMFTTGAGMVVFGSVAGKYGFRYMRHVGATRGNFHVDVNGGDLDPRKHRKANETVAYLERNIARLDQAMRAHAAWQEAYNAWQDGK